MNKALIEKLVENLLSDNGSDISDSCTGPWAIGKKYFIRTITMHMVGELTQVLGNELVMKNASWVADSGRFSSALNTGELSEVEPFVNDIIVNRNSVVDATVWDHDLPNKAK